MEPRGNSNSFYTKIVESSHGKSDLMIRIFFGLLLLFSFIKLPVTINADKSPQSWEAVLSFGVSRHLQWGQDIIFTYGPLGFLTSDYYWGDHFWVIFFWSFGFAFLLTVLAMRFLERIPLLVRIVLCLGLPWLTTPRCGDLGIDPVYLFAITIIGIAILPGEHPGILLLVILGAALGCLSLIKFTFCLYCIFVLMTAVVANLLRRRWKPGMIVIGSSVASFLGAWLLAHQNISNIGRWFQHSMQIASGYSAAMAIPPPASKQILGILIGLCLAGLLFCCWLAAKKSLEHIPKICLLAVGIFLAWKEGFVRADLHVIVFWIYAFLAAAMMSAFFRVSWNQNSLFLPLTLMTMILALVPFALQGSPFMAAAKNGIVPRLTDTITAVFTPFKFKHRLEAHLDSMREAVRLPQIAAIVGAAPVGVLNYDQDVAILNGFNYHPHPIFQNYSAYTPELQRINSAFFDSGAAPEFVLWRFGTIDFRFPTLDDGRIILRLLADYSPVIKEDKYVLWKRNAARGHGYSITGSNKIAGFSNQWIPIPANATWLEIELRETWLGRLEKFLCRESLPIIDVRLTNGQIINYHLPPGDASSGFIVNPLLYPDADLTFPFSAQNKPISVIAVKVRLDRWYFDDSILFDAQKIEGVLTLDATDPVTPERRLPTVF